MGPTTITDAPIKGVPLLSETTPAKLPYPAPTDSTGFRQRNAKPLTTTKALSRLPDLEIIMIASVLYF
jgi:hypothetical protein